MREGRRVRFLPQRLLERERQDPGARPRRGRPSDRGARSARATRAGSRPSGRRRRAPRAAARAPTRHLRAAGAIRAAAGARPTRREKARLPASLPRSAGPRPRSPESHVRTEAPARPEDVVHLAERCRSIPERARAPGCSRPRRTTPRRTSPPGRARSPAEAPPGAELAARPRRLEVVDATPWTSSRSANGTSGSQTSSGWLSAAAADVEQRGSVPLSPQLGTQVEDQADLRGAPRHVRQVEPRSPHLVEHAGRRRR